jgi:hypothetical protein
MRPLHWLRKNELRNALRVSFIRAAFFSASITSGSSITTNDQLGATRTLRRNGIDMRQIAFVSADAFMAVAIIGPAALCAVSRKDGTEGQ